MSPTGDGAFERGLCALLVRHGAAPGTALEARVRRAIAQLRSALAESATDGTSLSPRDVARIRTNKLFASQVPARAYRDVCVRAAAQAELSSLVHAWLGERGARGSWFGA